MSRYVVLTLQSRNARGLYGPGKQWQARPDKVIRAVALFIVSAR